MNELLKHPWVRVLLIATTVAMCSWALRETASITLPVVRALGDVLVPVAIGFCIAYVLTPTVEFLHVRWRLPRSIAAGAPFLLFLAAVTLGVMLVVPTAIRQSYSLAERLFKGEAFTDLDRNGHWDAGEPYVDSNANSRYDDRGMFDKFLRWLQEHQARLRGATGLEPEPAALVQLAPMAAELQRGFTVLDDLMTAAREDRDPGTWPKVEGILEGGPEGGIGAWHPAWPGPQVREVERLAGRISAEHREWWQRALGAQARATGARLVRTAAFIRHLRTDGQPPTAEELAPVLAAMGIPAADDDAALAAAFAIFKDAAQQPSPAALAIAKVVATRLMDQERQGQDAARLLLVELRGGSEPQGAARWLAPAIASVEASARDAVQALPKRLGDWARSSMVGFDWILELSLNLVLIPIYAFFLILAMTPIRTGVRENLPAWQRDKVLRIIADIEKVVAAFFRGRLLVCLICALITWFGFTAIGWFGAPVPYAMLFALLIGLATAVPFAGLLFLIPAVLLNLVEGGSGATAGAMIAVYFTVQGMESFVLTPGIMGREVELHPVTLIVAMLLCGKLIGVLGVILAVPIAASARILAREFLWPRVRKWAGRPDAHA